MISKVMISKVKSAERKDADASWWWIEALRMRRRGFTHREIGEQLRHRYGAKKGFDAETVQRALKHRLPEAIPKLKSYLKEYGRSYTYRDWSSKELLTAKILKRLEGINTRGKVPDGYSLGPPIEAQRDGLVLTGRKYVIDENGRGPEVREFWNNVVEGAFVADAAKRHDVPLGSAYQMLHDRFYLGEENVGTKETPRWVKTHPALIDRDVFDKAEAQFRRTGRYRRGVPAERRDWIGLAAQLSCEGKPSPEIADEIGVTSRIVDHWLTDKVYRKYLHPNVSEELTRHRKGGNWRAAKKIRTEIFEALERLNGSATTPQIVKATGRDRKKVPTILSHLATLKREGLVTENKKSVGKRHLATTWILIGN